jgi:hypothetical protein
MTTPGDTTRDGTRVELWVREPYPYASHDRQASVIDRLDDLLESDAIVDYRVATWGRHVPADPAPDAPRVVRSVREKVGELVRWAAGEDRSLTPALTNTRWTGEHVDDPVEVISLPVLCLVVYEDDRLVAVAPCWRGGQVETVDDRLDALERERADATPEHSTGRLVDGPSQGGDGGA